MKYLCLVYLERGALDGLSAEEQAALDRASLAYDAELARRGRFLAASALQGVATASTVRWRNGKCLVTDGPFAETKEVLAGFVFIEAPDKGEALEIAAAIPVGRYGAIEVRPELDFGGPA
jgi:hypothetical protein